MLLGGFDRVLDCVGSGASIEQATTITRARGRVILVGMPGELKADLAAAWLRELELRSAYGYENDFPAALEFAKTLKPGRLIDRGWPLRASRRRWRHAPKAARAGRVKTVFEIAGMSIAPTRMIERSKRRHPPPSARPASSRSTSTRRRRSSTPASRSGSSGSRSAAGSSTRRRR